MRHTHTHQQPPAGIHYTVSRELQCSSETHTHTLNTMRNEQWSADTSRKSCTEKLSSITGVYNTHRTTHRRSELQHILVNTWSNPVTSTFSEGSLCQSGTSEQTLFLVTDIKPVKFNKAANQTSYRRSCDRWRSCITPVLCNDGQNRDFSKVTEAGL